MITTDNIGFKLTIREPGLRGSRTVVVCPRYEGLKIRESRPSGKKYFQKELAGTLKLTGVDFKQVYGCALRTKFTLVVYMRGRGEVARCYFRKTDCKWDVNHEICEVDVSAWNPYKKIESGRDNEYNLVKLGLDKHPMNLYVYPQNQIYFQEDDVITLYGQLDSPTQPSVTPTHNHSDLTERMWFGYGVISGAVKLDVGGDEYTFSAQIDDFTTTIQVGSVQYKCVHIGDKIISGETYGLYFGYQKNPSGTVSNFYAALPFTIIWYKSQSPTFFAYPGTVRFDSLYSLTGFHMGGTGAFDYSCRIWVSYTGLATMQLLSGLEMPNDDITRDFNRNMRSRTPSTITSDYVKSHIGVSTRTSDTDKGYGRVENTQLYYDTPDDNHKWMPVRKDSWFGGISLWVEGMYVSQYYSNSYKDTTNVPDFYNFGEVIKAVVHEIDPDIHFECNTDHSQFLFDITNPVSQLGQGNLYISQKSNILNLGYDYPAWQAPITWGKIETLLNNAFNCYWDIYESNGERHLRIEHYAFYDGAFGYNAQMSLSRQHDLKAAYRNSTPYTYADKTNRWEWDKGNESGSANRYEYGWMDTQSAIFDGQAVEVPEEYQLFEDTNVEERKVDWFSSDIDFLTSVQAECSSDGFVIVMEDEPGWVVRGHANYAGQNYQLSFEYLQTVARYLFAGMYSKTLKVGDTTYNNVNNYTARMRKAEVQFRLVEGETMAGGDEVITEVGQGVAENVELDMSSGLYTATLRYKNE